MSGLDGVKVWLRMGDDDRGRYGGPEWVALDVGELYHAKSSTLANYEADMAGYKLFDMLVDLDRHGAQAVRAAVFIARKRAGVTERWEDFDPAPLQVKRRGHAPGENGHAPPQQALGKPRRRRAATSPVGSADVASPPSSTSSAQP